MPTSCDDCWFEYAYEICTPETGYENCPLVELPPHGRLVDADMLMKRKIATLTGWGNTTWTIDSVSCTEIKNAPTIIPAEEKE